MNPLIVKGVFDIGKSLINKWFKDPDEADKRAAELALMIQDGALQELNIMSSVITAEASSEHWLTANWRPITMLVFVGLISAHWLGFTPENLSEAQVLALLDIVQVGLGGYVLGRSGEKMIKMYKGNGD